MNVAEMMKRAIESARYIGRKQDKKENPDSTEEEIASASDSQEFRINLYNDAVLADKQSNAAQAKEGTFTASTKALHEFYEAIRKDLSYLRYDIDESITEGGLVVKWLEEHSEGDIKYYWDSLETPFEFVGTDGQGLVLKRHGEEGYKHIAFYMVKRHIDKYVGDSGE